MKLLTINWHKLLKPAVSLGVGLFSLGLVHSAMAIEFSQTPLFLSQPVRPIMMLNMSNDHQLFFKAYDDYSDLDGDGTIDTTYMNSYDYYGYFDSQRCYSYNTSKKMFKEHGMATNHYCQPSDGSDSSVGEWSGNFLNWATMTRIDTVRKILYGGKRSTDTASKTVLERAMLPQDAHSFAKYYNGTDLARLTPFSVTTGQTDTKDTGVTFCNTTAATSGDSKDTTAPPALEVAEGNFSLWGSNEGFQCRWGKGNNGNDPDVTGIYAYSSSPTKDTNGLGQKNYTVRVQVCAKGITDANNEHCKAYGNHQKPIGLLQTYGENDTIYFGLMTGSYTKNKSGGVLRKNVGSMTDELDTDGTFISSTSTSSTSTSSTSTSSTSTSSTSTSSTSTSSTSTSSTSGVGIIGTLDRLRISHYDFGNGQYNKLDSCEWGLSSFTDGKCTNWGNPQSEIYLESLRYLAGKSANFATNDTGSIAGLGNVSWSAPINSQNYCAAVSIVQFNASTSSYDGDQLTGFKDLPGTKSDAADAVAQLSALTDSIGVAEGLTSGQYFVGETGSDHDQLCTPKSISKLSEAEGTCPDAPRLGGSYQIAGLAKYAHLHGVVAHGKPVKTFGVALAPAVPKVEITVPGINHKVTILPACRNNTISGKNSDDRANCAITDFKVVEQGVKSGKLYVDWEDSEQGGDFDQDMWGVIDYAISDDNSEITVTTQVVAMSTDYSMGFGYVLGGTEDDGFHVQSGIDNFEYGTSCTKGGTGTGNSLTNCSCVEGNTKQDLFTNGSCNTATRERSQTFTIGNTTSKPLEQPLYYAARWGGFELSDKAGNQFTAPQDASNPTYFYATDPRQLEAALYQAADDIAKGNGAAASVATNSTRLGTNTFIYQATFDSTTWAGDLKAIKISAGGDISGSASWSAADVMTATSLPASKYITYNPDTGSGVTFAYNNLSDGQKAELDGGGSSADGQARVAWTKRASDNSMRDRDGKYLGDIVNSDPVYAGDKDYGFSRYGVGDYADFVSKKDQKTIFVGANDGMLHAFNAETGAEKFAYIPSGVYSQLHDLTNPSYGGGNYPHEFSVNGPAFVGDAYWDGQWRTLLVGTLGAGGKGLYVLDVTDPDNFSASDVLMEITPKTAGAMGKYIGNIFAQPTIAPLADDKWAIIVGNGYNSQSGKAGLLTITSDGTVTFIDTGANGDNGLSGASLTVRGDGTVGYAYAGDLKGNMWKFNLQTSKVAFSGAPFFVAKNSSDVRQPITTAPVLGSNPQKTNGAGGSATMVYFGTGQYLATNDLSDQSTQSFYGLADSGSALTSSAKIKTNTIATQTESTRTVSEAQAGTDGNSNFNWQQQDGWRLNFDRDSGERVITKPQLLFDRLIFPTTVPNSSPCDYGGHSWTMELVGVGGLYTDHHVLADQGTKNETLVSLSNLILGKDKRSDGVIIQQDSKGNLKGIKADPPNAASGRQSWRQLQ